MNSCGDANLAEGDTHPCRKNDSVCVSGFLFDTRKFLRGVGSKISPSGVTTEQERRGRGFSLEMKLNGISGLEN